MLSYETPIFYSSYQEGNFIDPEILQKWLHFYIYHNRFCELLTQIIIIIQPKSE